MNTPLVFGAVTHVMGVINMSPESNNIHTVARDAEDAVAMVEEFARVIALGYARFLNFQALARQNEELRRERAGHTLQATALVHDAYIRLVDGEKAQHWDSRGHFFAAAAEAMRRILIENARRKASLKRGGDHQRVHLDKAEIAFDTGEPDDLIALDAALTKLSSEDALKAELVKLRFFTGLSIDQAAKIVGVSRATAIRHWSFARTWLLHEMRGHR